jgi:hypothetical protein
MLRVTDSLQGTPLLSFSLAAYLRPTRLIQGGITLEPEQGELGADFCHLGFLGTLIIQLVARGRCVAQSLTIPPTCLDDVLSNKEIGDEPGQRHSRR